MNISFSNKNVLITGASSGIGKATAIEFARGGARVLINYNTNQAEADETVALIAQEGGTAMAVQADVSSRPGVEKLFTAATAFFGEERIDVLVNNAGSMIERRTFESMDDTLWQAVFDVNLTSVYLCSQMAMPFLRQSQAGRIINVTSVAARHGGGPGSGAYSSIKSGVLTITKNLARELAPSGITVNSVSPGLITTYFHDRVTGVEMRKTMVESIPLKREGRPQEVAYSRLFLASEQAAYITGETLEINGGSYMD